MLCRRTWSPLLVFRAGMVALALLYSTSSTPAHAGPLYWMNDLSTTSRVGAEFSMGNPPVLDDPFVVDAFVLTTDIFAKINVARALNLTFRLPVAFASFDDPFDESATAIGNLSGGVTGIWARHSGRTSMRFGLGGVLYINTASDDGDSGFAADAADILALPDPGRWANATTMRGRGDFILQTGMFFFQSELNLDIFFADGDDDVDMTLGLGPGFDISSAFSLMLELSVCEITDDEIFTIDAGMRYRAPGLLIGARLYFPTEEFYGEDVIGAGFDITAVF